jgi:2-polyprenyl-3-methyl-5-hydroxy-6-metoxy-1,4-benzoquinol methylase
MLAIADYADSAKEQVWDYIPTGAQSLLDVGCWKGAFGAAMKARGMHVWGIEPNPDAAAVAATRLDSVTVGSFPDDAPAGPFDVVTFIDVVEHFVDPWQAIRDTRRLLAPGGVVVAMIPNVRHISALYPLLVKGRWDYADIGVLDRTHVRFFTRATARELFSSNGYAVQKLDAVNLDVGKAGRLLRVLGKRGTEFRALHYMILAQKD